MLEPIFCDYNIDYMQRLGFLKVLCRVSKGLRGGKQEILRRIRSLYPEFRSPLPPGVDRELFDPASLLQREDIPSWQPGFSSKRLDRLVLWAEMVGLVGPNERLSEWARILLSLQNTSNHQKWSLHNPFVLTIEERTFFVHLLFYHDHVMVHLIKLLDELKVGTQISTPKSCLLITQALGEFFDTVPPNTAQEIRLRVEIRNILERIGRQYGLRDPRILVRPEGRLKTIGEIEKSPPKSTRVHLAEYHAICRFEQLTDLGLLVKEDPSAKMQGRSGKRNARLLWRWFVPQGLKDSGPILADQIGDIEVFLVQKWIRFCSLVFGLSLKRLDPRRHEWEMADILDATLSNARRTVGPLQVHSWAVLACIEALRRGRRLEIADIFHFLNSVQSKSKGHQAVRLGGRATFLGRTASVPEHGIKQLL